MSGSIRLAMIGLDGATWDVLRPLIEAGRLPHLAALVERGASGTLRSIVPPITGPAWSALATGKNPGRLGIFDFINRRSTDSFELHPIRSSDLAGQTFWDMLQRAGHRVGILNYPMLVPAYPIDGWMVSGLGASKLHEYTHPPELKRTLDEVAGDYVIGVSYGLPVYKNNYPRLIEDLRAALEKRVAVLDHLLEHDPVDLLIAIFTVSDVASHTLWEFWARDPAEATPEERRYREAYIGIWEALDEAVGRLIERLAPDGHALIVSDHGFGPNFGIFNLNQWLREAGYLRARDGRGMGNRLREWLVEKTTPFLGPLYKRLIGSRAQQLLRASILREIDLDQTRALALENSDGCGGIYINRGYARRHGLDEATFVAETRSALQRELAAWGAREGIPVEVHIADELYHGAHAHLAPELLVNIDDHRASISYRLEGEIYERRRHHPMKSGTHRMEGILIATGPRIRPGQVEGAELQDIAPTLLHLAGRPVPDDMDGRVLTELLHPEYRTTRVVTTNGAAHPSPTSDIESADDEDFLDRLRGLGYLE